MTFFRPDAVDLVVPEDVQKSELLESVLASGGGIAILNIEFKESPN